MNTTTIIGNILKKIADEVNISDSMQDKAVRSYQAVGSWIGDGVDYKIRIFPQGSMNLGTVARGVDDQDDNYDIDLVCLLENGINLDARSIKNIIGNRLKENAIYREKLDPEGKRCWTLNYDGFHMDILPCVPASLHYGNDDSRIRITNKRENGFYTDKYSNPHAYGMWFYSRMMNRNGYFEARNIEEIEKVPIFKRRTVLQQSIQILKRHRDVMFLNQDNAPISIIITTLAGMAYSGEDNLYLSLKNILERMPDLIIQKGSETIIPNPVEENENFAEKWALDPKKKDAFYAWVKAAKNELINEPLSISGIDEVAAHYAKYLGEQPTKRALEKLAKDVKGDRDSGNLYITRATGSLKNTPGVDVEKVKKHTFYGK